MSAIESPEDGSSSSSVLKFKKRRSRPKGNVGSRSIASQPEVQEGEEAEEETGTFTTSDQGPSLEDLIAIRAMRSKPVGIELDRLNKGEVRKKKKKKQVKAGEETEEDKWAEQMQKGGLMKRSLPAEAGKGATSKGGDEEEEDDEDEDSDDDETKSKTTAPRLVKQDNFQGETGTVDVDKHMMAYIEEEMQKRRQRGEIASLPSDVVAGKAALNPQDELFSIAEKYRQIQQSAQEALDAAKRNVNAGHIEREKEEKEEGNATYSQAMLTGVPEIDLGIDLRMKNIQETEKARRAMVEAQKLKKDDVREEDERDFASARFFKYGKKIQSDADIMRRGAEFGPNGETLPPSTDGSNRQPEQNKRQTATDDAALERFKKRQRNQLKRYIVNESGYNTKIQFLVNRREPLGRRSVE